MHPEGHDRSAQESYHLYSTDLPLNHGLSVHGRLIRGHVSQDGPHSRSPVFRMAP